jgi:NAD(P)-dependent dehydrogenase (short-subunit alcohol dehydrogenase family)
MPATALNAPASPSLRDERPPRGPSIEAPRVIVITGAFGALGAAVTDACLARAWRVGLVAHRSQAAGGRAPASAARFVATGVDLASAGAARDAMGAIHGHFGRIDGLVNVAGGFRSTPVEGGGGEAWDALFAENLKTALNATRAALPYLRDSADGRIVNVGAASARVAGAGMGAYAASKSAVHRLTESLAAELAATSITVNAVLPTTLDTPANRSAMPDADRSRWVQPAAAAKVIAFLLSDDAGAVSGALIPIAKRAWPGRQPAGPDSRTPLR